MSNLTNPEIFKDSEYLGVDSESKDPHLRDMGSGCYRKDGYTVGWSFATKDVAEYYPLRHPDTTPEEREKNERIIRDILISRNQKVFANALYDLDWAQAVDMPVLGQLHDVQIAEPLLNEYLPSYSLCFLANKYGLQSKATEYLENYCQEHGLPTTKSTPAQSHIWRMPSAVVSRYAKLDGVLAYKIFKKQEVKLKDEGLYDLYLLEMRLTPLLLRMRKQGVRLDLPRMKRTAALVTEEQEAVKKKIFALAEKEFNIKSTLQLSKIFDKLNIPYPRNPATPAMLAAGKEGNPNLNKHILAKLSSYSPKAQVLCQAILKWRHYQTLIDMFFIPYLEMHVNGRLHCNFNQLRSDQYGAVSGRFSSSRPNLQQVPAMSDQGGDDTDADDLLKGQIIRKLFIPEEGCLWGKADYSQVEYRIMAHYATGPGADELRHDYCTNPNADHHKRIQDRTGFDRRTAKRLNFGAGYGMGERTAAELFGWSLEEAQAFMAAYHVASPYLKPTRQKVISTAEKRGYIYTLLGRRARVHPSRKTSSFFNRLIQGSAADIMKKALVDCWESGIYDILIPHITVHDEIDVSIPDTPEGHQAFAEQQRLMETALALKVPLKVDSHTGKNWAEAD